jgi:hypothetical protein
MNQNLIKSLISSIALLIISFTANSQTTSNNGMSFTCIPTLLSGNELAVGSKYLFTNVYPGTSAVVTIVSATGGATVGMLDDNNLTKPEAFSPMINVPANSNGLVEFKIEFYQGNGNQNIRRTIDTVRVTAMDIDGNSLLHEVDALDMGAGSVISYQTNTLEIDVVRTGNEYKATNIGGVEYPAVDTSAKQVMFTLMNTNINTFTYKVGANNLDVVSIGRQKGNYFKGFDYTQILPLKYISFDAVVANKTVILHWITAEEINTSHFEIEYSTNGNSFSKIGTVLSSLSNNSKNEYSFQDNSAIAQENKVAYYRLKQFDKDGKFSYSKIIVVRLKNETNVEMQVSPNPFTERLMVRFNSNNKANVEIRIVNLTGQIVATKILTANKGFNNMQIDGLSLLPSGTYIANFIINGKVIANQKIVK